MSMELYVFSDRQLNSIAEWQSAVRAEQFDISFDVTRQFADMSGFLPVNIDSKRSGFECDHFDASQMIDELNAEGFPVHRRWKYLLAFRFGGNRYECVSAQVAAAIYMRATDGVLFDCEEGAFYGPESALDYARKAADPVAWD
jgi:hypothetical protein